MERLLDDVSFDAADRQERKLVLDAKFVRERLEPLIEDQDLARYIL